MSPVCSPVCPGIRRTVLCILLLSGLCSCLHHYHLIDEPKTWHEAQKYCREKYTDLATIDNMEDMEQLIAAAGSGYEGKVWIGLYDRPMSWGWSLSDISFYGEGERSFRRWDTGEPNNVRRRGQLCVAFRQGSWCDDFCHEPLTFVCYSNTNTPDLPTTSIERYFFINQKKTWREAQAYCRQYHTDLASVRNEIENTVIQRVVPGDQVVSIGLQRQTWIWWSDDTKSTFENWADGHPLRLTESCAASVINATHLGKWVENDCGEKFHFMCHNTEKKQLFNVKLTALKSTIDLNDPAVTEAILNLIEKKMKEKGITRDFKIAWIKKPDKNIFHKEDENADAVKTDL